MLMCALLMTHRYVRYLYLLAGLDLKVDVWTSDAAPLLLKIDPTTAWIVGGASASVETKAGVVGLEWSASDDAQSFTIKATIPYGVSGGGRIHLPIHPDRRQCFSATQELPPSCDGGITVVDVDTGQILGIVASNAAAAAAQGVGGDGRRGDQGQRRSNLSNSVDGIVSVIRNEEQNAVVVTVLAGKYHFKVH